MEKTIWDISKLHNWDKNPRSISEKGFTRLKKQIQKLGMYKPLLVTEDGTVLGGNMRLRAYRELGIKDVWVSVVEADTEEKKLEYALSDNDRAGFYDDDLLANLTSEIPEFNWGDYSVDLKEPTNLQDLLDQFKEVVEDEVPEIDDTPAVSKLGEVYQLGRHRLMCGDSTKIEDVEKLMEGKKAELLFTSPPYSDMREYEGGKDLSVNNLINFIGVYKPFVDYQVVNLGIQRSDENIVRYWDEYLAKAEIEGYKLLAWNVWDKGMAGSIGNQSAMFPLRHEWIFVFGEKVKKINMTWEKAEGSFDNSRKRKVRQPDGHMKLSSRGDVSVPYKKMESVLAIHPEQGIIRLDHPATYPVGFPREYIIAMTNIDDVVVDPFGGSGSTLIACEQTNRTCYMMEIDQKYCDVIRKRYSKFIGKENEWQTI